MYFPAPSVSNHYLSERELENVTADHGIEKGANRIQNDFGCDPCCETWRQDIHKEPKSEMGICKYQEAFCAVLRSCVRNLLFFFKFNIN